MLNVEIIDQKLKKNLGQLAFCEVKGNLISIVGETIKAKIPTAEIGDYVSIENKDSNTIAKIVGFESNIFHLQACGDTSGIRPNSEITLLGKEPKHYLNPNFFSSVINHKGEILLQFDRDNDFLEKNKISPNIEVKNSPLLLKERKSITKQLETNISSIDHFIPIGFGQRLGIFAEPGVGKSTLLAMIAKNSNADFNIFALIGERSREAYEFAHEVLDEETRSKSIIVVATSDEPVTAKIEAANLAMKIAETLRELGHNVLLQVDSLTRLSRSLRDAALASGEIAIRKGYPSSAFLTIAKFLEKAGNSTKGSITGLYTILDSSDLDQDPIVDEIKGYLDGHILLSKNLASKGHFPAIDVLQSLSRLEQTLLTEKELEYARKTKKTLAVVEEQKELLSFGAKPTIELKNNLIIEEKLNKLLIQKVKEKRELSKTKKYLEKLFED